MSMQFTIKIKVFTCSVNPVSVQNNSRSLLVWTVKHDVIRWLVKPCCEASLTCPEASSFWSLMGP